MGFWLCATSQEKETHIPEGLRVKPGACSWIRLAMREPSECWIAVVHLFWWDMWSFPRLHLELQADPSPTPNQPKHMAQGTFRWILKGRFKLRIGSQPEFFGQKIRCLWDPVPKKRSGLCFLFCVFCCWTIWVLASTVKITFKECS